MSRNKNRNHQEFDERQQQTAGRVGTVSFMVMFFVCVAVIIVQLTVGESLMMVAGETAALLAGGITCLVGYVRNGLWTGKAGKMSIWQEFFLSILFSGTFSVLYAFVLGRKVSSDVHIGRYVIYFFVGITVLCFLCLVLLNTVAGRRQKRQEQKYED